MSLSSLALTLALTLVLPLTFASGVQSDSKHPTAPDGRRGFGVELSMQAVQKLLHSSKKEDEEFVARLRGLASEIKVLIGMLKSEYEQSEYFDLLERTEEHDVLRLNEVFFAGLDEAKKTFGEDGEFPPAMARVFTDVGFVLRAELLSTFELDEQELRGGLTLLYAHRDGYANLRQWELPIILERVDLAAARLRSLALDLDLLRKNKMWRETAKAEEEALLGLAKVADPAERDRAFRELEKTLQQRLERARSTLFSERLREKTDRSLFERGRRIEAGAAAVPEVRTLVPDTEEGKEAPDDIAELSKHKRYGYARRRAMDGLSQDPFNADLCYFAGLSSDFLDGARESLQWFDRYLALRGIRSHDHRSYDPKKLTPEEQYALDEVQRGFGPR